MRSLSAPERPVWHRRDETSERSDKAGPRPTRPERRDPAPSRFSYRWERLWLTPFFRGLVRVGLPGLLILGAGAVYLGDSGRRDALGVTLTDLRREFEERPEFMVGLLSIDGASEPVAAAIRKMLPVSLPASSFQLDLEALQARIESVDAVASASLRIKSGGVLAVEVTERQPVVLWRVADRLEMLDETGHRVATLLDRSGRPDLPVLAGTGADVHVPEALAILNAARPVLGRVRGLVRMGERRWDLVLDRDQRLMLPEEGAVEAMERAMALDAAQDMLGRDLLIVDLRNEDRPTLRLAAGAVQELREIQGLEAKVTDE